jgi:hypothetical protein
LQHCAHAGSVDFAPAGRACDALSFVAAEGMGRGGSAEVAVDATDVLKPRTDSREYRCVALGNALQALIIGDPETDKVRSLDRN